MVNTAKYLSGQPVVAVNPDPAHIDGILLPFNVAQAPDIVRAAMDGQMQVRAISMAQAQLNDGQSLLAFNDLFVGVRSHVSARYRIALGERAERHSSSGVIVSTGAGSTGWLSSMFNMTAGMARYFAGEDFRLPQPPMDWESDRLFFVVREPFVSKTSSAGIVCGEVTPETPLLLESHIPQGGVIFSDGVELDYLDFNAGAVATVQVAEVKTNLVVG